MTELLYIYANGFSPVWILSWFLRVDRFENSFLQVLHSNDFSPVWVLSCLFKSHDCTKHFPQDSHWNFFSFEWNFLCSFNLWFFLNNFWHISHWNFFSTSFETGDFCLLSKSVLDDLMQGLISVSLPDLISNSLFWSISSKTKNWSSI